MKLWRPYALTIPRVCGVLVGLLVYLFITVGIPAIVVWTVDSHNLRMTAELARRIEIISLFTDTRNSHIAAVIAIFITALFSSEVAKKLDPEKKPKRKAEKEVKAIDKPNKDDSLTWKGIG